MINSVNIYVLVKARKSRNMLLVATKIRLTTRRTIVMGKIQDGTGKISLRRRSKAKKRSNTVMAMMATEESQNQALVPALADINLPLAPKKLHHL